MIPLKRLYDLQELDWEIQADEKALAEVKARLADNSAVASARRRLDGLEATLAKREPVWKQAEFTVQQLIQRLQDTEGKLYGGGVTNPRELSAYEEERKALQRQRGVEEEKLLDLLVEVEELQSERNSARESLTQVESRRAAETAELSRQHRQLTGALDELRQAREAMIPEFTPQLLALYDSLLKSRGGHAIARVERDRCQGCRIALPSGELQRAKNSEQAGQVVQCSSCRRILYVP